MISFIREYPILFSILFAVLSGGFGSFLIVFLYSKGGRRLHRKMASLRKEQALEMERMRKEMNMEVKK